jgi:phospholipid transport system substrate-binding protein
MTRVALIVLALMAAAFSMASATASAVSEAMAPHQLVEDSISRIIARVEAERAKIDAEPAYARQVVREELDGLVDFKRITRLVMADYFQQSSKAQKYAFLEVFQSGLINTYASGITLYQGQKITVFPTSPEEIKGGRAQVKTELEANDGRIVPIFFSLYQTRENQWMVENIIVNGLNLGKTFRAQFAQSAQQANGDIDQVIAGWSAELERGAAQSEEPTP